MLRSIALAAVLVSAAALPATAQEEEPQVSYVCTFDQFLPGFGFVPITLSPDIYGLLGGDPADCQTPVEDF